MGSKIRIEVLAIMIIGYLSLVFFFAATPKSEAIVPPPIALYNNSGPGWGNGCLVGSNLVITAAHVVKDIPAENLVWQRAEGNATNPGGKAQVRSVDLKKDLAVVILEGPPQLPIGTIGTKRPKSGDPLWAQIGSDAVPTILHGWLVGVNNAGDYILDMLVFPGVSGSCLFNDANEIIGIIKGLRPDQEQPFVRSMGVAVPISEKK